jgi:hypothetical protein
VEILESILAYGLPREKDFWDLNTLAEAITKMHEEQCVK